MKKLIPIILLLFFVASSTRTFSQTTESSEIPQLKSDGMFWLGESNGNSIFYTIEMHKPIIKLTIYKLNSTSLELTDSKTIVLQDFNKKIFDNCNASCKVEVVYKNNKFYIFYSLIYASDYYVYLKTLDENLANEKNIELGAILKTGKFAGDFYLTYSPDYKTALVVLKNFREKENKTGIYTEIYENTELINYDLINDKVIFSKKLPIEIEGLRLKSEQYKLDNEGNIACVTALAERKDVQSTIRSMAIGYLEKNKEQLTAMDINLKGISTLTSNFYQLKNGDLLYIVVSELGVKVKYISPKDQNKNFEKTLPPSFFKGIEKFIVLNILEHSNGFYLTLKQPWSSQNTSAAIAYGVASISKTGDFLWYKSFELIKPIFKHVDEYFNVTSAVYTNVYNNKLHVFYIENQPYEMTEKIKKQLDKDVIATTYNLKKFNTIEMSVDENGKLEKQIINDNQTFVLNPYVLNNIQNAGNFYFIMTFKNAYKVKKIAFR